jgi:hypothetical protein
VSRSKTGGKKPGTARPKASARKSTARTQPESPLPLEQQFGSLLEGISDLTTNALKFASKTRERAAMAKEMASGNEGKDTRKTPEDLTYPLHHGKPQLFKPAPLYRSKLGRTF